MDESKARFRRACAWLLSVEGDFVDDPADRGGPTKFGIGQSAHPDLAIVSLTQEQAEAIYFFDYWQRARCGRLPQTLGLVLFDAAVQHGPKRAVRLLQEVLRIRADGINGPSPRRPLIADWSRTPCPGCSPSARCFTTT